jgi:antitoxin ParD1/3/4
MPTRNVVLTERQADLIETLVESGRYQNASEVLRDGLRLVEQREAEDASKLKALRAAARVGVGALDRGEFKEFRNIEDLQAYFERPLGEGHFQDCRIDPQWPSGDGASASAPPQNSTLRISSNGPLRILARENRVSIRIRSFRRLANLPKVPMLRGSKALDEIMPGLRTVHVARHGRRGSHFLMYRVAPKTTIEIVRILHDRMDLQRHLPFAPDENAE